jgi:hypothetical protein
VTRHRYQPDPYSRPLNCDAYDETTPTLIESESSTSRETISMSIGQLVDYARLEDTPPGQMAVLVPTRPRDDLIEFLHR